MPMRREQPTLIDASFAEDHPFEFHWFAFFQGWEEDRKLKAHHLRDGVAFSVLSATLMKRGGRYGGLFRNGPATREKVKHYQDLMQEFVAAFQLRLVEDVVEYRPVDESFLQEGRVLVVPTRLPMNDFSQKDKVQVQPGFTSLEEKIIRVCRPYLPVCSRSRVRIADGLAACLTAESADRVDILFHAYAEPWYKKLRTVDPTVKEREPQADRCRTMAYLLQLPRVPELNGADLLLVWGQGGTQTLALVELLNTDLAHLLDRYGFSMVELTAPEWIRPKESLDKPYELLDSLGNWETEILLENVLLDRSGRALRAPKPPTSRRRRMKRVPAAKSVAQGTHASD